MLPSTISYRIYKNALFFAALFGAVQAQKVGTSKAEVHPSMAWQTCAADGTCTTKNGKVVIDANWRWVHDVKGYTNCYTGNTWNAELCPDNESCAENCALEGADYAATYGATTSGNALSLKFVTQSQQKNIGSRLYMMKDDNTYETFKLLNQEFTFDVDVSNLPCGLNGALYFVSMDADGGLSRYTGNEAGAKYGTGYCDSQCPRDLKFINGLANVEGWTPSSSDANAGNGGHGSCCAEMDIWEANSISTAYTPHPCDTPGQAMCNGDSCGGTYSSDRYGGTCDPDGCDFNSYRQGNKSFYGPGMTVDTKKKMTVVTQFLTNDGTATGTLSEIKRFYVQDGKVIANSESTWPNLGGNSLTNDFCKAQKTVFGDMDTFSKHGGMEGMGAALAEGMVLVMSLWDDHNSNMLWLDSNSPTTGTSTTPGVARGSCDISSGDPKDLEANHPDASVVYSNIKVGPIGSTFNSGGSNPGGSTTTTKPATSTTTTKATTTATTNTTGPTGTGVAQPWAQCGGIGYSGPTQCAAPYTCTKQNDYYSQCL
ncbi:putative 1,4-beta-D-glucan-cellobiohydrolyase [Aspergillus clavatus NRRL 1]|uniref:Probable 1,4-beta-D-glucan cellobiohydrolase B n=1 Tax=Aspergillus clavatus (strain ATCC 1007 / CBS 513.65 / DSM 816 / NCTC 3887 / NRRL 1 / QM 1276 / 107) TaxID=344612 RepID=CBHB_ASPCL|nr:glycosyl hydrolase family 7 protein [Aspergillus clavatus NRRL 1]A1CU44.1 RecName: Full=Probable 1,4-beta-D-glucan cellobiohydrolase B; AltName: Full=Beta-glucancellobiohydrolase B; AltName: Full=Exocellobiohydrolase B; AltName: Full=Exoglucanase B; Flags: Precursor [Aspergillus clavatus NRRL 1]EAW06831.1 glycosyl hydrolase family 7 protein [Aspergillus clavatus NRRL 1]